MLVMGRLFFGLIVVFIFFLFPLSLRAQTASHLVISEVQVSGQKANDEFVEIYNPTNSPIVMNGWRLTKKISSGTQSNLVSNLNGTVPAHGFFLITPQSDYDGVVAGDVQYSQTSNFVTSNNTVLLYSDAGVALVDKIGFGSAGDFESGAIPVPPDNQSVERKPGGVSGSGEDTENNANDFSLQTSPNPQNSQSSPQPPIQQGPVCGNATCETGEDSNNCSADCPLPPAPTPVAGDMVINELVADPVLGSNEWIELFNKTANSFDISGFKIYDGSGSAIATLAGSIPAGGFFVVDISSSKLNNSGDVVTFQNASSVAIDTMTYGDWDDGDVSNNAPSADDPNSIARIGSSQDTGNDAQDFAVTTTVTKGAANIITDVFTPPPSGGGGSFTASDVAMNEFVAQPESGNEWIELYLNRAESVALDGWKIYDGTGNVIFSPTGTLTSSARYAVFELSSARLNNEGDIIILKSPDGATIDSVAYGDWNDGNIADNAPASPKSGQSVARKSNGGDTGADNADFSVSDSPTKGASNVITVTETIGGNNVETKTSTVPKALLYINEFVSDPADGEEEWVEIYNAGDTSVDFTGWYIEEGSGGKTKLAGTSIPGQFMAAGPISGNLNNGGDVMYLKDVQGNIFDRVAYGVWDDGNVKDNAQVASDPASIARACDGCDAKNNSQDFRMSFSPTRGKANVSVSAGETIISAKILISEFLPDPEGEEASGEFIELQNFEPRAVNLAGWYLKDASGTRYVFGNFTVPASGFLAVWRAQSKIALNNNKETVTLFSPDDAQKDQVLSAAAKPGQSYALIDGKWQWTSETTPGKANIFKNQNHPPVISTDAPTAAKKGESVEIDAGDSSDPDGDTLTFTWIVGGEAVNGSVLRRVFDADGEQTIVLEISDGKETAKKDFTIAVGDSTVASNGTIFISEVLPNPEGSDAQEWIELFYDGGTPVNLDGFSLDDVEGGSRPYVIKGVVAEPHSYFVLERGVTGLAFNNEGDRVRLFDPAGKLLNETVYTKSSEGLSWSRQLGGSFAWRAPTKGEKNSELAAAGGASGGRNSVAVEFSLSEVRDEPVGARVKVRGAVAVPPGVLGSQIFYLSGSGIQIYMNKKDFPEMKVGDVVEVEGELSEARGERRIKVSARESLKVISGGPPPMPHEVGSADVGEEYEGNLVAVHGTVIETKGSKAVIDDDNGEVVISIKNGTGIDSGSLVEGMQVKVVGIVSQRGDIYEILPRSAADIEVLRDGASAMTTRENKEENGKSVPYGAVTVGTTGAIAAAFFRQRIARFIASAALFGLIRRPPGGGQNS
ncbi:MAG: lamin tail domain-containing protein [Patescibacteria group bacterium]